MSELIFTDKPAAVLSELLRELSPSGLFVLTPGSLRDTLLPAVSEALTPFASHLITITDDEEHKTLESVKAIWETMLSLGATRRSLIVNIGGGITTDMGGYAAACYMRGIRYVNIPTTLLAMVDASTGGKTGVNLQGTKNIIGAFHKPEATIICPGFLMTLPHGQLLSGYGEMLKHALLKDRATLARFLSRHPEDISLEEWPELIKESVGVKERIVALDPMEKGLRRVLNLGHTAGHALEALSHEPGRTGGPLTHGHAVAVGLVTALVLSHTSCGFPSATLHTVAQYIRDIYPTIHFNCADYGRVIELMGHDKKNPDPTAITFCLLEDAGRPVEAVRIAPGEIRNAFDITRDLLGL